MGTKTTVWIFQETNGNKKNNLQKETKSLLIATQNNATRIIYIKARSSHSKDSKMVLDATLLNSALSRVKRRNLGKGVAPSPTPWCSSYRKESLRVPLNYGCQLYFFLLYIKAKVARNNNNNNNNNNDDDNNKRMQQISTAGV